MTPTDDAAAGTLDSPAGTPDATTGTVAVDGARLHHEVRGSGPLVALVGSPMGADSFAALADLLAVDHTVVTLDPRGTGRSPVDDPDRDSTPEMRADDLARLLAHLDARPAVVLGSSGGAVTALALAQAHPEGVRAVVAHEPPLEELLDDRAERRAAAEDIVATYRAQGSAAAWAKFLADANIPADDAEGPGAVFGTEEPDSGETEGSGEPGSGETGDGRDAQEVADERFFFLHEMLPTTRWVPDLDALRAGPRIVVGIGGASTGQLCDRTSTALAAALGIGPTSFPGGHIGFVEDPAAFATRLRAVLAAL